MWLTWQQQPKRKLHEWQWWNSSNGSTRAWTAWWESPESTCNSILIPFFIKTVFCVHDVICRRKRQAWDSGGPPEQRGQAAQKLTLYGTGPSWSYHVPPKRFLDCKSVHLTCLEKKMECRWSVDVLKQPKKKQQGKSLPLTLWWLISLQNDPLFLCSIQISEWVRVRMEMKQEKRDPLNTHCGGSDGLCLVTKRTWCFCEFAGGARITNRTVQTPWEHMVRICS